MYKFILFIIMLILCINCKGEQQFALETNKIYKSRGVEVPVYDFEGLEPLLHMNDEKIRIVNFWTTSCKPCVAELPYFEQINSKYASVGVEVILVSLDFPDHVESKLIPFVRKHGIQSKVVLLDDPNANSWIPKVNKNWTGSIPATIIYKGDTSYFYEKSFMYAELEKELKKML